MASVKATKTGSSLFSKQHATVPHLEQSHGVTKEIGDLRNDVAATLKPQAGIAVDEFTAPAASSTLQLSAKTVARAGAYNLLHEFMDGARISPPTGTINSGGVYAPAAAPNGTHNYVVYYEYDGSSIADA